jgi:hypothetical protein
VTDDFSINLSLTLGEFNSQKERMLNDLKEQYGKVVAEIFEQRKEFVYDRINKLIVENEDAFDRFDVICLGISDVFFELKQSGNIMCWSGFKILGSSGINLCSSMELGMDDFDVLEHWDVDTMTGEMCFIYKWMSPELKKFLMVAADILSVTDTEAISWDTLTKEATIR